MLPLTFPLLPLLAFSPWIRVDAAHLTARQTTSSAATTPSPSAVSATSDVLGVRGRQVILEDSSTDGPFIVSFRHSNICPTKMGVWTSSTFVGKMGDLQGVSDRGKAHGNRDNLQGLSPVERLILSKFTNPFLPKIGQSKAPQTTCSNLKAMNLVVESEVVARMGSEPETYGNFGLQWPTFDLVQGSFSNIPAWTMDDAGTLCRP
ncbi:hypothetical protein B0H14DRAFT_2568581 [Mycena olivaceomarginata]|nr:hypothetical protein B0H14DRAFT_2568581 [Mycena olivaceomarginata]